MGKLISFALNFWNRYRSIYVLKVSFDHKYTETYDAIFWCICHQVLHH